MAIDSEFFIKTAKVSALTGVIFAAAALIPPLMPIITLFVLPFLAAPLVLAYLKIIKALNPLENRDYATLGGAIGLISGSAFLIVFCPLVLIIHLIFPRYYTYGINFLNIFLGFILFASIICIFSFMNVAMGLLMGFLFNYFNGK